MNEILRLSFPVSVWITGFSANYALQGLSCSRHWPIGLEARPVLLAGWAIAVALQAISLAIIVYKPSSSRFVQATAIKIAATAFVAAIWTIIPVLVTTGCL